MTNKIEQSALYVVQQNGELQVVTTAIEGAARIAPVYLDGQRLEGVFSEVRDGTLEAVIAGQADAAGRVVVPAGVAQRDGVLKKWSDAAKKGNRVQKAGLSTIMLLTLAACGGNGGSAVTVKTDMIDASGDVISITGASGGAVISVADAVNDKHLNVTVNATGSGELRFVFVDSADEVVLSSNTVIAGFSTIVVEKGTVDFTNVTLPASVSVIQVGSGAVLTYAQYASLGSIELRAGADASDRDVDLKVLVTNLAEARLVDADARNGNAGIIKANVDVAVVLKDGAAGELSIAELAEIRSLISNEVVSYSIKDSAANLFTFENGVAVGFKDAISSILEGAQSLAVSGTVLVGTELLAELRALGAQFSGQVFNLERSQAEVDEGGAVVFTLTTLNVPAGSSFVYQITGVSNADVVGGAVTGAFVVGADGKAVLQVTLTADRLTEGQETLTLTVNGLSQSVVVNDTSVDPSQEFTSSIDMLTGTAFGNFFVGTVSTDPAVTTFGPGDSLDGAGGSNILRLFMAPGAVADGVEVRNIQTLDLRLNAGADQDATSHLVMSDWDDSLQQMNIRSNKSNLVVSEQQTIADIAIVDNSTADRSSSYSFGYAAGVLDGTDDHLNLSVNNVNGTDGSIVSIDAGMESVAINVADRAGEQYASDINLFAAGVEDIAITGGRSGQTFTLDADVAAGAALTATAFAGNLNLTSGDIRTAALGAGDDVVNITGQAANAAARYDLGEGNNTINFNGVNLGGAVIAGDGRNTVNLNNLPPYGNVLETGSITLGNGGNTVKVDAVLAGTVTTGSGDDVITVGSTAATGSINAGGGLNRITINGAHRGAITDDNGDNFVIAKSILDNATMAFGDGDNVVSVSTNGGIVGAAGPNDAGVVMTFGDGSNRVGVGYSFTSPDDAGFLVDLEPSAINSAKNADVRNAELNFGNGDNALYISRAFDTSTMSFGNGANVVQVNGSGANGFKNSTAVFGDGANTVTIKGQLQESELGFGDGHNQVSIGNQVKNSSLAFGEGDNALSVDGQVKDSVASFGDGANTLAVKTNVNASEVAFGDGGNTMTVGNAIIGGSQVTFGAGADALTIGTNEDDARYLEDIVALSSNGIDWNYNTVSGFTSSYEADNATIVDMGEGDDQLTINVAKASAGWVSQNVVDFGPIAIGSGAFVDGGAGSNDTLTLNAIDSAKLIAKTNTQKIAVQFAGQDLSSYAPGDIVTLTIGDEQIEYVIKVTDIVQGDGIATVRNLVAGLSGQIETVEHEIWTVLPVSGGAAKLLINGSAVYNAASYSVGEKWVYTTSQASGGSNTRIEYQVTAEDVAENGGQALSGYQVMLKALGGHTVLYLVNDHVADSGLGDVAVSSDIASDIVVTQIGDARVVGFENLELVALNNSSAAVSMTLSADFNLVEGVDNILLDSQVEKVATENGAGLNGAYTTFTPGGVTTFNLTDLRGGEAITVAGHEASATGNSDVYQISVGTETGDHQIGDIIRIEIGGEWFEYTVQATDLSGGADAVADAVRIANGIKAVIEAGTGLRAEVDNANGVVTVTILGAAGEHLGGIQTVHVRLAPVDLQNLGAGENLEPWNLGAIVGNLMAGDTITIKGGDGEVLYTTTLDTTDLEAFCKRTISEMISQGIAAEVADAAAHWGIVRFAEPVDVTVTRLVNELEFCEELGFCGARTTGSLLQHSSATDDNAIDVVINARLSDEAAEAEETTMDLTVNGYGNFDIRIANSSGYTDLDLVIADDFSHYINTGGVAYGEDTSNFSDSLTMTGGTAGEHIYLDEVAAKSVTIMTPANVTVNQYGDVYGDNPLSCGGLYGLLGGEDFINVSIQGAGDAHLITHALAALNAESSIDLGLAGANRLSLGWGWGDINGEDLAAVGRLNYTGSLFQLDILNDVVLNAGSDDDYTTVLDLPGTGGLGVLTLTDLDVQGWGANPQNLTIAGAADDFAIKSGRDFELGFDGQSDHAGILTVQRSGADNAAITGNLSVIAGSDIMFALGNDHLASLTVEGDDEIDVHIVGGDERTVAIGAVTLGGNDARLWVGENADSAISLGEAGGISVFASGAQRRQVAGDGQRRQHAYAGRCRSVGHGLQGRCGLRHQEQRWCGHCGRRCADERLQ